MFARALILSTLLSIGACRQQAIGRVAEPTSSPTYPINTYRSPTPTPDHGCLETFPTATRSEIPDVPIYPNVVRPPHVSDLPDTHPEVEEQIHHAQRWIYFDTTNSFPDVRQFYEQWGNEAGWKDGNDQGGAVTSSPLKLSKTDACPYYSVEVVRYRVEDNVTTVQIKVLPQACECMYGEPQPVP